MAEAKTVYTEKFAPEGNALFDMLTKQNQATFQHGLDMEKQEKANDFTKSIEILRAGNAAQREREAFQRQATEDLMKGQAVAEYTQQQAVQQAGQGNVFPGLVEQVPDVDVERATGHPLFTPRPIDPRAAATAHGDLQKFIEGRTRTQESEALAKAKLAAESIGPAEVQGAQQIANELQAAGLTAHAAAFRNLQPGSITRKEYFDSATKVGIELQKAQTRREVSKTFASARVEAARISAEARKTAAELSARSRISNQSLSQLKTYGTAINQQITKLQTAANMARKNAENSTGDEKYYHANEADQHEAQVRDLLVTQSQVAAAIGKANDQPVVDEKKYTDELKRRQIVIQQLADAGKIRKRKTWAELNPKEQALVEAAHRALLQQEQK